MQSPIAHICRHRARTDAQRAAIARNRTHLHVHSTNMCLIQGICSHALLLRTLLRTFLRALLRWRVLGGDEARSSQPTPCCKRPTRRLCRISARRGHRRRVLFVRSVAPLTRCLHVACAAASPVTAPLGSSALPLRSSPCIAPRCLKAPRVRAHLRRSPPRRSLLHARAKAQSCSPLRCCSAAPHRSSPF